MHDDDFEIILKIEKIGGYCGSSGANALVYNKSVVVLLSF